MLLDAETVAPNPKSGAGPISQNWPLLVPFQETKVVETFFNMEDRCGRYETATAVELLAANRRVQRLVMC